MNSTNSKHYSVETGIIFLLMFLVIAGVIYNIAVWTEQPSNEPNIHLCPLCEK
jgi:hypothetical protein